MSSWSLSIEGGSKTINDPSWEEVQEAIKSLDGRTVTQADISLNEGKLVLTIAGGKLINERKLYAVQFYLDKDNEELFGIFVNHEGDPDTYHTFAVEGIATDFAENNLLEYKDAESIFKYVFENKEIPPDREWE